jgi:hypothetical protein
MKLALLAATAVTVIAASTASANDRRAATLAYCSPQMHRLVNTLTTVEGHLAVGVKFSQYTTDVGNASTAYNRVNFKAETYQCVSNVGVPSEKALNDYTRALNVWRQCLAKSLTSNCLGSGSTADKFEQRQWDDATLQLRRAVSSMA